MPDETYNQPEHGWTCFHCGETFTTAGAAQDHFGFEPSQDPGCIIKAGGERGLLMALRKTEQELLNLQVDTMDDCATAATFIRGIQARHTNQLVEVEQAGYDKGLADGRKMDDKAAELMKADNYKKLRQNLIAAGSALFYSTDPKEQEHRELMRRAHNAIAMLLKEGNA